MEDLIGQLKPDVISIEELFFNTNLTTGIAVAHARGVLLCTGGKVRRSRSTSTPPPR